MLNIPLLRKMVDLVTVDLPKYSTSETGKSDSKYWEQGVWISVINDEAQGESLLEITESGVEGIVTGMKCGTAACLAGETWIEHGPVGSKFDLLHDDVILPNEEVQGIRYWAAEQLGLTLEQSSAIFNGSNSAKQIQKLAAEFIQEAEEEMAAGHQA